MTAPAPFFVKHLEYPEIQVKSRTAQEAAIEYVRILDLAGMSEVSVHNFNRTVLEWFIVKNQKGVITAVSKSFYRRFRHGTPPVYMGDAREIAVKLMLYDEQVALSGVELVDEVERAIQTHTCNAVAQRDAQWKDELVKLLDSADDSWKHLIEEVIEKMLKEETDGDDQTDE